ncbi:MAG: ImmA/IrrE family metallo-endopeptidase [Clostridia bacterium]|nr:ImmA/IrrE family metallo-endopeptidase [Clostridia bacterium]
METNRLYAIAEKNGITVDRFDMQKTLSASVVMDNRCYIAVDNCLSGRKEKVSLAHEVGHCVTGSFYNMYAPLDIRKKHEKRADRWAIKKLIPRSAFKKAVKGGADNLFALSEFFEVTPDFMQKAIDYYSNN